MAVRGAFKTYAHVLTGDDSCKCEDKLVLMGVGVLLRQLGVLVKWLHKALQSLTSHTQKRRKLTLQYVGNTHAHTHTLVWNAILLNSLIRLGNPSLAVSWNNATKKCTNKRDLASESRHNNRLTGCSTCGLVFERKNNTCIPYVDCKCNLWPKC